MSSFLVMLGGIVSPAQSGLRRARSMAQRALVHGSVVVVGGSRGVVAGGIVAEVVVDVVEGRGVLVLDVVAAGGRVVVVDVVVDVLVVDVVGVTTRIPLGLSKPAVVP